MTNDEENVIKSILYKLAMDAGGELVFGDHQLDVTGEVVILYENGVVSIHAIPNYVKVGVEKPAEPEVSMDVDTDGNWTSTGSYKYVYDPISSPQKGGGYVVPKGFNPTVSFSGDHALQVHPSNSETIWKAYKDLLLKGNAEFQAGLTDISQKMSKSLSDKKAKE